MEDDEIGFDDWEKEAELIENQTIADEHTLAPQIITNTSSPSIIDPHERHLLEIERIKKLTTSQFDNEFKREQNQKEVEPFNTLLKCQKDFIELAKNIGQHFRTISKQQEDKVIPENELLTFFEEFTLYLYGNVEWQSLQIVKQKIKIIKKDKKQEQSGIKKQREKQHRLKRTKQDTPSKQYQQSL